MDENLTSKDGAQQIDWLPEVALDPWSEKCDVPLVSSGKKIFSGVND